MKETKRN